MALLLPHSAKNWNIRRKEGNQQQTQPILGCMGKENEKEKRKKRQNKNKNQKYTFYYRLYDKFFLIIHPADDWFILL